MRINLTRRRDSWHRESYMAGLQAGYMRGYAAAGSSLERSLEQLLVTVRGFQGKGKTGLHLVERGYGAPRENDDHD